MYGLGYHLLIIVYDKKDDANEKAAKLNILNVVFVDKERTGDWQTTKGITDAMLCKTAVARNILTFTANTDLPIAKACIWKINSKKHFDADVDACLFRLDIHPQSRCYQAEVFSSLDATKPTSTISMRNGYLISNNTTSQNLECIDGSSSLTWRQGLKHDAASIFELQYDSQGQLHNKLGEIVQVEAEYVYPLLKGSDLGGKDKVRPQKVVIVTQRHIGEDTYHLEYDAPLLWKYLTGHRSICDARKSSIYEGKPPFVMFGIGDYSFSPYKVAISGLHKIPKFSAIGPFNGRPVPFDDTCYFVAFASPQQAALLACLLNHPLCIQFLHSIVFWDAKRPITKKLLQRIDLIALLNHINKQALLEQAIFVAKKLIGTEEIPLYWPERLEDLLKNPFHASSVSSTDREVALSKPSMLS